MNKCAIRITFERATWMQPLVAYIVRRCIKATLAAEGVSVSCEINVLITDDDGIHMVNKQMRDVDRPTDVLSFPMFQFEAGKLPEDWSEYLDLDTGRCPLGDMCISVDRARAQAKEFGHSVKREIGYLTIHSVLHLLGYDHLDEGPQKAQMRAREEKIAASIRGMSRD